MDRQTGEPIRRYERTGPASWSTSTSRNSAGSPPAAATGSTAGPATRSPTKRLGYTYIHTAIDDYTRLAYSEVLADETGRHRRRRSGAGPTPGSPPTASSSSGS